MKLANEMRTNGQIECCTGRLPADDTTRVATGADAELRRLREELATERSRRELAETALRETLAAMIKHQQVGRAGNFRFNTRTGLSTGSPESYKLFGYDSSTSTVNFEQWSGTIHPEDKPRILKQLSDAVTARQPLNFEYRIVVDGVVRHIRCDGEPDHEHVGDLVYYGVLSDVTLRKAEEEAVREMQNELSRAMRLAALGELAGSIVHEVSQPLGAIQTSAQAALRWLARAPPAIDEARASLSRTLEQGRRASAVVKGMRSLAQGETLNPTTLNINDIVSDVLVLVRRELERSQITLELDLDPTLTQIGADRIQLQHVVLNLVRNAVDAILSAAERKRVLTVVTQSSGDERIQLAITDSGIGFDSDTRAKLFTPLFSTKQSGMGLGLSICRRIVQAHGGRIWAESLGRGASFFVELPCQTNGTA